MVEVLRALVEHYATHPDLLPDPELVQDPVRSAVTYVAGMTDRYAFDKAVADLGWDPATLPRGVSA